jgi:hypothetical protein
VGRWVHYYDEDTDVSLTAPTAALITEVIDHDDEGEYSQQNVNAGLVDLTLFPPGGMEFHILAEFSAEPRAGFWTWPPNV